MKSITAKEYQERRQRLAKTMAPGGMLILAANIDLERTKDVPYPFRQSNNYLYLTGDNQPDGILVISCDEDGSTTQTLYVKKLHPFMASWEGRSNKLAELAEASGISDVKEYTKRQELLVELLATKPNIVYIDMPGGQDAQPAAWQVWDELKTIDADVDLAAINPEIEALRVIKSPAEVDLIKAAIAETQQALRAIKPMLKPGVTELEVAAELTRYSAAKGIPQAWPPIVSFGKNACVVHHTPDATPLEENDLVLFDLGVEVEGYTSDVSRMLQIGQLTPRQQQVMDAVKDVQTKAMTLIKPGIKFNDYEDQVLELMQQALVDLGLFKTIDEAAKPEGEIGWPAYRRYYSHWTSHYLGLDGHDVGSRELVFKPGMVLTCEPGIYIAEEGIGVRIEDDLLVTEDGNINLSAAIELDN